MNIDYDASSEMQYASQRYLNVKNIFEQFTNKLKTQISNNTGFAGITINHNPEDDFIIISMSQIKIRCQLFTYLSDINQLEGSIIFFRKHIIDESKLIKLGSVNFNQNGDLNLNLKNSDRLCNIATYADFIVMHFFKIALSVDVDNLI